MTDCIRCNAANQDVEAKVNNGSKLKTANSLRPPALSRPPAAREARFEPAVGIERQHADAVAMAKAYRTVGVGRSRDPVAHLAGAAASVAKDYRDAIGRLLQRALQASGQVPIRRSLNPPSPPTP